MSCTVLVIDAAMAGLVIGRSGRTIKGIANDSGATTIRLFDGDTPETKKVKIFGTEEAQTMATSLIENIAGKILELKTVPEVQIRPRRSRKSHVQREPSPSECLKEMPAEFWDEMKSIHEKRIKEIMDSCPPIHKDFYVEHNDVKAMSVKEVNKFKLSKNNIMVKYVDGAKCDRPIPKPIKTFEHAFHAFPEIMRVIKKQKFIEPTPIQCQAWPIIMSGFDVIAIAQTGTGKTLAYILPALIHLVRQPVPRKKRIGPSVVILGPTRELVLQIEDEIKKYIHDNITVMSMYGGCKTEIHHQRLLNEKPDIIVATPGRMYDMVGRLSVKLDHVSFLILDEADRMLQMGFKCQIELALRHVRPDRQTVLTSATWPKGITELANYFSKDPLHITIGSINLTTVETVEQKIIVLKENEKQTWLDNFISKMAKNDKVIIFMRKKVAVQKLYEKLIGNNIDCRCMHGGKLQVDREESLADMRNSVVSILIATDLAARGLDIHDISMVINYDFPLNIDEYVHRVGRTGRAGKKGSAITLFTPNDKPSALPLVNILQKSNQPVPPELLKMCSM